LTSTPIVCATEREGRGKSNRKKEGEPSDDEKEKEIK